MGRGARPEIVLHVANSATTGIAAATLDTGRDKVVLAPRHDGATQELHIREILSQDDGMLQLEVR